jgi:hypothetical protein
MIVNLTYLGSTAYLLNHVAHTSAASSDSPKSVELNGGVERVSKLEPVAEADGRNGDAKLLRGY